MGVAPFVDTRGRKYEFERILQGRYRSDVEGWDQLSSTAKASQCTVTLRLLPVARYMITRVLL